MSLDTLISTQKTAEQEAEITKEIILENIDDLRQVISF